MLFIHGVTPSRGALQVVSGGFVAAAAVSVVTFFFFVGPLFFAGFGAAAAAVSVVSFSFCFILFFRFFFFVGGDADADGEGDAGRTDAVAMDAETTSEGVRGSLVEAGELFFPRTFFAAGLFSVFFFARLHE